jgi:hypothetical protein
MPRLSGQRTRIVRRPSAEIETALLEAVVDELAEQDGLSVRTLVTNLLSEGTVLAGWSWRRAYNAVRDELHALEHEGIVTRSGAAQSTRWWLA